MRGQKYREATLVRADGVVSSANAYRPEDFAGLTTPSARTKVASRCFLTAHPPPPFQGGESTRSDAGATFCRRSAALQGCAFGASSCLV